MTEVERALLAIESQHWRHAGAKLDAILALGVSSVRAMQVLDRLIDSPEAIAVDPITCRRLRERRARRVA